MSQRSDEERERARLEREARRAARAGETPPLQSQPGPQQPPPVERQPPEQAAPAPPQRQEPAPSAARASRAVPRQRPHVRERVEAALARSHARRGEPRQTGSVPGAPGRLRRRGRFLTPIVLFLALFAVAAAWFLSSLYQPGKGEGTGRVPVVVPRGGSLGAIADRLGAAGVVDKPFFFKLRVRMAGHASDLKPGSYVLAKDMPYGDVIDKLTAGPPRNVINLTIPEGRARSEIAPLVKQAGITGSYTRATMRSSHLNPRRYGAPRGAGLEGFLFPATYELKRGATVRALVAKQLATFKENFPKVGMSYARKKNLTPYDVLTIAAMVEREASLDRERPLIAAVIYNRLKEGIPLGIDATIRFATGNWTRPLRVSELKINSAYNTRTHQGLPPGPIGNPGLASLKAAAHPSRVNYLFYVVKPCGDGAHAFSSTDAQFQRDVTKYNTARAKKGGKSPSKC